MIERTFPVTEPLCADANLADWNMWRHLEIQALQAIILEQDAKINNQICHLHARDAKIAEHGRRIQELDKVQAKLATMYALYANQTSGAPYPPSVPIDQARRECGIKKAGHE